MLFISSIFVIIFCYKLILQIPRKPLLHTVTKKLLIERILKQPIYTISRRLEIPSWRQDNSRKNNWRIDLNSLGSLYNELIEASMEILGEMSNYIHIKLKDTLVGPCSEIHISLAKPSSQFGLYQKLHPTSNWCHNLLIPWSN